MFPQWQNCLRMDFSKLQMTSFVHKDVYRIESMRFTGEKYNIQGFETVFLDNIEQSAVRGVLSLEYWKISRTWDNIGGSIQDLPMQWSFWESIGCFENTWFVYVIQISSVHTYRNRAIEGSFCYQCKNKKMVVWFAEVTESKWESGLLQMQFRRCVHGDGENRNKDSEFCFQKAWQDKRGIITKSENLSNNLSCEKVWGFTEH